MRRIGVAFPGDPNDPSTWSGTPSGIMRGLREAGATAVAVSVRPSSPLVRSVALNAVAAAYLRPGRDPRAVVSNARAAARASLALTRVTDWSAPGALRRAGPLDGIIQIGTGYTLPADVPIATFEDMTIQQLKTQPYSGWDLLGERTVSARTAMQRRTYERAIACCLTSRWAAESVIGDYGVAPDKVHVVGLGRNHSVSDTGSRDWTQPRFLFVGIDWARKNGDAVVRAFARLREEVPSAHLDVVGGHPPLAEPGVTGHGILRLDVPEQHRSLESLFSKATCFVMPSHSEASAIAYVEAAAAGLPSIGTGEGGSDFLIGEGGLIVNPKDDDALLDAMRLLSDPGTAARVGAAAKRRSELFTWRAVADRLLRALAGAPAEWLEATAVARNSCSCPSSGSHGRWRGQGCYGDTGRPVSSQTLPDQA
jgi:glycosyltransferase involved in cell wall biosynthesis